MAQVSLVLIGIGALAVGIEDERVCGVDKSNPGSGILACLRDSAAYITTPAGAGTGLLLDDGHIVTNAHVINPFGQVSVVIAGDAHDGVPVVGVDLAADIAVLGPIDEMSGGITFGISDEVIDGGTLFLVGYPGEIEEVPDPTIAQGILSRRRNSEEFDLHYLQTDASIGGGQSGGALVNNDGEVVGISTLKFAESFALALSADDATRSIERILDGDGDDIKTWPIDGDTKFRSRVNDYGSVMLLVPPPDERTALDVTVSADVAVLALDFLGEPIGASANYLELFEPPFDPAEFDVDVDLEEFDPAELSGMFGPSGLDELERVGPNRYEVPLTEGQLAIIEIIPVNDDFVVSVESSHGAEVFDPGPGKTRQVKVGDTARGILDGLTGSHEYRVRLEKGQEVEIRAASPSADMIVSVLGPRQLPWEAEIADDGGGGLYDLDASLIFEADSDGMHTIGVGSADPTGTAYLLEVTEI